MAIAPVVIPASLRPKRLKRPPAWLFPQNAENAFVRFMKKNVGDLFEEGVKEIVIPLLPRLVQAARVVRPDSAGVRVDALVDEVAALMSALGQSLEPNQAAVDREAVDIGVSVASTNKREMRKIMNSVLGVDVFTSEPFLADQVDLFRSQNVDLVSNLKRKGVQDLNGIVQRGLQSGLRVEEIEKQINAKVKGIVSNAKLIARDQVAKLNGQITQLRQESIGVTKYKWRTVKDERVRDSHKAMDGKTCIWSDPKVVVTGSVAEGQKRVNRSSFGGVELHPGQDFQCRCTASPVLDDLIGGIDDEAPAQPSVASAAKVATTKRRAAPKKRKPRLHMSEMSAAQQDREANKLIKTYQSQTKKIDDKVAKISKRELSIMNEWQATFNARDAEEIGTAGYAKLTAQLKANGSALAAVRVDMNKLRSSRNEVLFSVFSKAKHAKLTAANSMALRKGNNLAAAGRRNMAKWTKQMESMIDESVTMFSASVPTFEKRAITIQRGRDMNFEIKDLAKVNKGRAFVSGKAMHMPADPEQRQFFHEIGHVLEASSPQVRGAAERFLAKRTEFSKLESLAKEFPGLGYGPDEMFKRGNFSRAYAGKIYEEKGTEIMSIGVESMVDDPETFLKEDPEFFRFVVKTLAGAR